MNCLKHVGFPAGSTCPCWALRVMEEHKDLFRSLGEDIKCPSCDRFVKPPFANLGSSYNQAEGCMDCYVQIRGVE